MHRVFVYGTLKRGLRNHHFLEHAAFVGEAHTLTKYRMLDGSFPVLRDSGADLKQVRGEVYDVDEKTLEKLDELESVDSGMYERVKIDVAVSGGKASRAFIYIGRGGYWDKKERVHFVGTDERGHLNWIAPNMRSK